MLSFIFFFHVNCLISNVGTHGLHSLLMTHLRLIDICPSPNIRLPCEPHVQMGWKRKGA